MQHPPVAPCSSSWVEQHGSAAEHCSTEPPLPPSSSHTLLPASLACRSGMCPFIKNLLWAGPRSWRGQNQSPRSASSAATRRNNGGNPSSTVGFHRWTTVCNNLSFIKMLEGRQSRHTHTHTEKHNVNKGEQGTQNTTAIKKQSESDDIAIRW